MKKRKLKKKIKKLKKDIKWIIECQRNLALRYNKVNEMAVSNLKDISDFKTLRKNMQETINHLNKLMADIKEKEFKDGNNVK